MPISQCTRIDPAFPLLTTARVVCSKFSNANGDESLSRVIDTFLDNISGSLSLSAAYKISDGSLRLLQYIAARESTSIDPFLRRWEFNNVTGQAAASGDLETLKWLVECYSPEGFLTEVVTEAADNGHLHVLTWLWENHRSRGYWGGVELCHAMENKCNVKFESKYCDVVKWLRAHVDIRPENAQFLVRAAAADGDVKLVQLLCENFDVEIVPALYAAVWSHQYEVVLWFLSNDRCANFRFDNICLRPAEVGDLKMLKILFDKGITQDHTGAMSMAASRGHLHIVKWFYEEVGFAYADGCIVAAANGHLDVFRYLFQLNTAIEQAYLALCAAATAGCLEIVQWIHINTQGQRIYTHRLLNHVARRGHLKMVQWVHTDFWTYTHRLLDFVAGRGHLKMVQWLHENRAVGCTSYAMHTAAEHGHIEVVKWLHKNRSEGCQTTTMMRAAECGNLEMVQWLHASRSEDFDLDGVMDTAAGNGHLDILQWFHENRNTGCTTAAMDTAAANGHLDVVKWLHEHRGEGCTQLAMDDATENGHLEVVKWMHLNLNERCSTMAIDKAAGNNHLKVVKWLLHNRSQRCTPLALNLLFMKSNRLDTAVYLYSKFPECRAFQLSGSLRVLRLEVIEWLVACAPSALKGCLLIVSSWNWYICDWLRRNNWQVVAQGNREVVHFSQGSSDIHD